MADSKITQLTELTSVDDNDLLAIVDDVAGTPLTKKVKRSNLMSFSGAFANGNTTQTGGSTGNMVIAHGLGKVPKYFRMISNQRNGTTGIAYSEGTYNGTQMKGLYQSTFTAGDFDSGTTSRLGMLYTSSGNTFYVDSVSWDATNVTVTWAKLGSPTSNTVSIFWEAYA